MRIFSLFLFSFFVSTLLLLCRHETVEAFSPELHVTSLRDLHNHLPIIQNAATSTFFHHPLHDNIVSTSFTHLSSAASKNNFHPQEILASLYSKYRQELDAKPLQTKIMTGCTLAVVGDAIAQSRGQSEYNLKRAASFVAFDGCWRAVQVGTYKPLVATCTGQFSLNLLKQLPLFSNQDNVQNLDPFLLGAMEQTLVSQLILIPLIYYPVFYATTGLVQGLTLEETLSRAKETFIPLMKRNLMFWIPTQFAVFGFVEENLQIPILIVCGLVWTIILSLSAGNASEEQQRQQPTLALADGGIVESNMAELGAVEAAMGLNGTSFYYAANISTHFDQEYVDESLEDPIQTIPNTSSKANAYENQVQQ
ncbi:Mpv17 / PMP22 family protein [Nitzschia inconspicua]|uniref:Mpv17 / PMP22 family protein n=1 Tax=Nitzschia inconspicua TaxID=303405 RepID=A0A9K3L0I6_9STRA|nr:Mpv17 / PMP22 family protein [Nitzschia inconspicua]